MPWSFSDMYGRQKVVDANVFPVMVPIFDTTLTGSQATIDIQNIPQNYSHLLLITSLRSDSTGTSANSWVRCNGDTTAGHYFNERTSAQASAMVAGESIGAIDSMFLGDVPAVSAPSGMFSAGECTFPNYANASKTKSSVGVTYAPFGTVTNTHEVRNFGSLWNQISALTRLTIYASSGNLVAGSQATLYGLGTIAPASPGSVLPVTYSTTLPSSPLDGQEAILVDNTSTPTYSWRFRYNANSANTDQWEFVGGTPKIVTVSNADTTASSSATDLANVGPAFTAPRAGIYQAQINADGANNTGGGDTFLDFKAGGNAAVSVVRMNRNSTANVGGGGGGWVQGARVNASDVLKMQYHVATGTGTFENRTMAIQPLRVS